jgi:hypothetical protein
VVTLVILGLGAYNVVLSRFGEDVHRCSAAVDPLPSLTFVLASIAGFVLGHVMARWLDRDIPPRKRRANATVFGTPTFDDSSRFGNPTFDGLDRLSTAAFDAQQATPVVRLGPPAPAHSGPTWLARIALLGMLGVGAIALAYETSAVVHEAPPFPITWYVRCAANSSYWGGVVIVAFLACFLLGHWVWYGENEKNA